MSKINKLVLLSTFSINSFYRCDSSDFSMSRYLFHDQPYEIFRNPNNYINIHREIIIVKSNFKNQFILKAINKGEDIAIYKFFSHKKDSFGIDSRMSRYEDEVEVIKAQLLDYLIKENIISLSHTIKNLFVMKNLISWFKWRYSRSNKSNHFKINNKCNFKAHREHERNIGGSIRIPFDRENPLFLSDCRGINFKKYIRKRPLTLLNLACNFSHYLIVKTLLLNGAQLNFSDEGSFSSLRYIRCFSLLIEIAIKNVYTTKKTAEEINQMIISAKETANLHKLNMMMEDLVCYNDKYIAELVDEIGANINRYYHNNETLLYKIVNGVKYNTFFEFNLFALFKSPYINISRGKKLIDNNNQTPLSLLYNKILLCNKNPYDKKYDYIEYDDKKYSDLCNLFLKNSTSLFNRSDLLIIAKDFSLQESYLNSCLKERIKNIGLFLEMLNLFLSGYLRVSCYTRGYTKEAKIELSYDLIKLIYYFLVVKLK